MSVQQVLMGTFGRDLRPLGDINASCVFDLDATIDDSYNGAGAWKNMETTPADGSAQAAYDFTNNGMTFTGAVNSPGSYFSTDGNDYFQISGGNTNFLRDLHKTVAGGASDFTLLAIVEYSSFSSANPLLDTAGGTGSGNYGLNIGLAGTSGDMRFRQHINGTSNDILSSSAFPAGSLSLFGVANDRSGNQCRLWRNTGTAQQSSTSWTNNTTNASGNGRIFRAGSAYAESGSKVRALSMFNTYLDDAAMTAILNQYQLRHERAYL